MSGPGSAQYMGRTDAGGPVLAPRSWGPWGKQMRDYPMQTPLFIFLVCLVQQGGFAGGLGSPQTVIKYGLESRYDFSVVCHLSTAMQQLPLHLNSFKQQTILFALDSVGPKFKLDSVKRFCWSHLGSLTWSQPDWDWMV